MYGHDAEAQERGLTPDERRCGTLDQGSAGQPVMDELHAWLGTVPQRKTEPNPGLGRTIGYLLRQLVSPLTFVITGAPKSRGRLYGVGRFPASAS